MHNGAQYTFSKESEAANYLQKKGWTDLCPLEYYGLADLRTTKTLEVKSPQVGVMVHFCCVNKVFYLFDSDEHSETVIKTLCCKRCQKKVTQ
jgi:hypothetical protein